MYSKSIPVGSLGQVSISEQGGVATVKVTLSEQAGGNEIKGFAKASLSAELDVDAMALVDAGLVMLEGKFPAVAPLIATIKGIIDSEATKV